MKKQVFIVLANNPVPSDMLIKCNNGGAGWWDFQNPTATADLQSVVCFEKAINFLVLTNNTPITNRRERGTKAKVNILPSQSKTKAVSAARATAHSKGRGLATSEAKQVAKRQAKRNVTAQNVNKTVTENVNKTLSSTAASVAKELLK